MKKLFCLILSVLMTLLCSCFRQTGFLSTETISENHSSESLGCVVLDAGHGGIDEGCIGSSGSKEAEINLAITLKLRDYLVDHQVACVLTREDKTVRYDPNDSRTRKNQDMSDRADTIRNAEADAVVSIHMNQFDDASVNGPQVFYRAEDEASRILAQLVQEDLSSLEEVKKKREIASRDNLFILNSSDDPSILIECGFLSNPEEERLLMRDDYQQLLAETIGDSIIVWLTQNHT